MSAVVLFIIALALPIVLLYLFKVDGAIIYFTLCMGYVLTQFISSNAISLLTAFYPNAGQLGYSTIKIILLLIPSILTMIFMFHSISGPRRLFNILPSIATGLLLILLLQPLLPENINHTILASNIWTEYQKFETFIVGGGSLFCLALIWTNRKPKHAKSHSK